ncbi:MAG: hypothetical protein U1G07_02090 [Verrucomicrobiota bacterium]
MKTRSAMVLPSPGTVSSWRDRIAPSFGPRRALIGFSLLASIALSGCLTGPAYQRPAAFGTNAMPITFAENGAGTNVAAAWKPGEPAVSSRCGRSSAIRLKSPETLAAAGNQELAAAVARFDQARALVNVARSGSFPAGQPQSRRASATA